MDCAPSSVDANDLPVLRPAQKRAADERVDYMLTRRVIETPEAARLGQCQTQAGHLEELAPHTIDESV